MHDGLGWVATALFATSYFCKTSRAMRRLQASAAASSPGVGCPFVGRLRRLDECPADNRGERDRGCVGIVLRLEATAAFERSQSPTGGLGELLVSCQQYPLVRRTNC